MPRKHLSQFCMILILIAWPLNSAVAGKITTYLLTDPIQTGGEKSIHIDIQPYDIKNKEGLSVSLQNKEGYTYEFKFKDDNVLYTAIKAIIKTNPEFSSYYSRSIEILVAFHEDNKHIELYAPAVKLRGFDSVRELPSGNLEDLRNKKKIWKDFQIVRGETEERLKLLKNIKQTSLTDIVTMYRFLQYANYLSDVFGLKIEDDELISNAEDYLDRVIKEVPSMLDALHWTQINVRQLLEFVDQAKLRFIGRLYKELENWNQLESQYSELRFQRSCSFISQLLDEMELRKKEKAEKLSTVSKIDLAHFETMIARCLVRQTKKGKFLIRNEQIPQDMQERLQRQKENLRQAARATPSREMRRITLNHVADIQNILSNSKR